jgi:hypothetical protein
MEGWSLFDYRGQHHLKIAKAADQNTEFNNGLLETLLRNSVAIRFQPKLKQRKSLERKVFTKVGGNAGYKRTAAGGEVSLDILLYGSRINRDYEIPRCTHPDQGPINCNMSTSPTQLST